MVVRPIGAVSFRIAILKSNSPNGCVLHNRLVKLRSFWLFCCACRPLRLPLVFSLTIFLRWLFRGLSRSEKSPATRPGPAFISMASRGSSPSAGLIFRTGAGGYSSSAIAASGFGVFGCHEGRIRCRHCLKGFPIGAEAIWATDSAFRARAFLPLAGQASSAAQSGFGSSVAVGGVSSAGGVC